MIFMYYTQEQIDAMQAHQERTQMAIYLDDIFKKVRIEGNFILTSGKKSNYFYDFEQLSPNYMTFVSGMLHEKIKDKAEFEFIVGPGYGGIIPGYCVADFAARDFIAFNPKSGSFRGNTKRLNGRYVVIDDVISTYGTVDKTIYAMSEKYPSTRCVGVGCFVFRGEKVREGHLNTYYLHRGEVEV